MSSPVIALYRPKPGQNQALLELVRRHHGVLTEQGLVTDRAPYVLRAKDGTLLEIFEWKSDAAVEAAHTLPAVRELWGAFEAVCDFVPLKSLPEAEAMFPHFEHVPL